MVLQCEYCGEMMHNLLLHVLWSYSIANLVMLMQFVNPCSPDVMGSSSMFPGCGHWVTEMVFSMIFGYIVHVWLPIVLRNDKNQCAIQKMQPAVF